MLRKTLPGWLLVLTLLVSSTYLTYAAGPPTPTPLPPQPGSSHVPVEVAITVRPDGKWKGEARFFPGLLEGDDPREIVQAVLDAGCADERLAGPIVLDVAGSVHAGEVFSITLPGNLSTGYSWETLDGSALSQVGDVETVQVSMGLGAPVRQVFRLRAMQTGAAGLRLIYRRPWEASTSAAQMVSIRADGLDLPETCAALSSPMPSSVSVPENQEPAETQPAYPLAGALPSAFNWCNQGGCTPIRDQGQCGSCWAFATVGTLELALKIQQGLTTDLSEQYLVSCNTDGWGCDGGWWAHDYHLNKRPPSETQAGAVLESAFPYRAKDIPCAGPYSHPYRISSWHYVGGSYGVPSVDAIQQAIYTRGPVGVALCAGTAFQRYTGGIFQSNETWQCLGGTNHAVVLVGWDDSQQVWILRNSWGPSWGENGTMRIRYGTSRVGYAANYIVYTTTPPSASSYWTFLPVVMQAIGTASALSNSDLEAGLHLTE